MNQHYEFAHRALPAIFFHDPPGCVETLKSEGRAFLLQIWKRVGEVGEVVEAVSGVGLDARALPLGAETEMIAVTLPEPAGVPEAHFVALVYRPAIEGSPSAARGLRRYFTLEYGLDLLSGQPITILGEWTAENRHMNHGEGPDPTLPAFIQAVRRLLEA